MAEEVAAERQLVLSMLPAGLAERRFAAAVVILSILIFIAAAPYADVPLPRVAAFIPCYAAALVVSDLITAALLFGQFAISRHHALLVLASGYLFTALMTISHALSFPGLFSESGLLGAGPQSTAWLYMFWHGGFPVAVVGYALLKSGTAGRARDTARSAISSSIVVVGLVLALTVLATAGERFLPKIMQGNGYTPSMIFTVSTVWLSSLLALLILFMRRPHSVLDLWLMAVMCAWLCDVALSAVLNAGRFDLGFYVGRIYGLTAASLVLVVLLVEIITLYARLARSFDSERQQRERRLKELHSELIHVSRLSELGQMVSALAHEVNQPLGAINNYVRAGLRFVQNGESNKAQVAMEKAADEAARAAKIVQRLRGFIRKDENDRQPEDLRVTIEEAVALALAGCGRGDIDAQLRLHPEAVVAFIDKIQIQQVLLNLIRNAVEAMANAPEPRLVIATAPTESEMIEVSVADFGPGLPSEVREKLFQPFVTTKSGGMGVGLSICRSIVEAHGGRLWAEDRPGGGTVFRFTVQRARAVDDRTAAPRRDAGPVVQNWATQHEASLEKPKLLNT